MDISWLAEPQTWIGFATLLILEVVLGIDNLVFVAILANKVKPSLRDKARLTGLALAVIIRIIMLASVAKNHDAHIAVNAIIWHGDFGQRHDYVCRRYFPALQSHHRIA